MKTVIASLVLAGAVGSSFVIAACSSSDNTVTTPPAGNDSGVVSTGNNGDSGTGTTNGDDSGTVVTTPDAGDTASIARGSDIVTANGCKASTCHGSDLGGDVKQTMGNYSANITFSMTGLGEDPAWTVTDLSNALRNHVDNEGVTLCGPMPVFDATAIPDQGVQDVYNYLMSVTPSPKVQPDTDCSGNPLDGG